MSVQDTSVTLGWMREGEAFFLRQLDAVGDDVGSPSPLPGWTRGHVATHVARNADALGRLVSWARTGVETPMYASVAQRNAEIAAGAGRPAAELRADVTTTAAALSSALAGLDEAGWAAKVRTMRGRAIPAAEIPWMRVKEAWLHAVDLGGGATVGDLPGGVVDALLDEVSEYFSCAQGAPALQLVADDRSRTWAVTMGQRPPVEVSGSAADLLAWLIGRSSGSGLKTADALPPLPAWL